MLGRIIGVVVMLSLCSSALALAVSAHTPARMARIGRRADVSMLAILFDCDGVLADTERDGHRVSWQSLCRGPLASIGAWVRPAVRGRRWQGAHDGVHERQQLLAGRLQNPETKELTARAFSGREAAGSRKAYHAQDRAVQELIVGRRAAPPGHPAHCRRGHRGRATVCSTSNELPCAPLCRR